jgi:hypothetical protein
MGWLKTLLRREQVHDTWLAQHPGKESVNAPPPGISEEEERRTRARMESEMEAQRSQRQKP